MAVIASEFGIAQPGALGLGVGLAAIPVFTPGARALATAGNRPYIGHLYTNAGGFKELIGPLVEAPSFKISINGGHHPLTVQIASKDPNALRGDLLEWTEQGGDGTVVYKGIIEDLIEGTDPKTGYTIQLQPLVVELGDTPFSHEYYQQTDVAQMARDAVVQCQSYGKHLTYTGASIPLTGITGIYSFVNATSLRVLEEAKKIGGPNFFYYVDENGLVTFGATNLAGTAAYEVRPSDALKVQGPISTLYNFIAAIGGTPLNATVPIASVYDDGVIRSGYPMANPQTAIGSQFGVRAQTNLAFDTNDQATLDQIVNTIGSQTNRVQTRVEMTLTGYPTRIVPGATLRYFEQAKYPMSEYRDGSGVESSVYVVMDNEIDGAVQKLVCSDIPISPDDLAYVIENRLRDALAATQVPSSVFPISPFQLPPPDGTGGPPQEPPPVSYVPFNPGGGSPGGSYVPSGAAGGNSQLLGFHFFFDTPGLQYSDPAAPTGHDFYTPTVGDIIVGAYVNVITDWNDGIVPSGVIAKLEFTAGDWLTGGTGFFQELGNLPDLARASFASPPWIADDSIATGSPFDYFNTVFVSGSTRQARINSTTPLRLYVFDSSPIGVSGGTTGTVATAGEAILYLQIYTPTTVDL